MYSSDEEENQRHVIWESNKNYVDNHNKHTEEHGFTLEMNKFADLVTCSICVRLCQYDNYDLLIIHFRNQLSLHKSITATANH